jgi:hypothetical protein
LPLLGIFLIENQVCLAPMSWQRLFFLLGFFFPILLHGQEQRFALSGHLGSFVTKMSKSDVLKDDYSRFIQLDWSRPTPAAKRTNLGVILLYGGSGGNQYLGTITAAMAFADQPLLGHGWYRLHARIAIGLGYISKPFDPVSNHKNTLLGSHLNASVQASIYQEVRIGKHISWNAGASFLHLSNGLTTLPNLGLNIPAITTGFAWRLPMRDTIRRNTETVLHKNSWQAWATVGPKQWPLVNSPRRIVSVLGVEWSRRLHANGRWGALVQLLHDPSPISPSDTIQKAPAGGGFQVGLGVHYTIIFNRLELPLQAAVYAFNQRDGNTLYESIGVRYQVNRRLYAGIHLKTHMGKADYLHAGIGYEW